MGNTLKAAAFKGCLKIQQSELIEMCRCLVSFIVSCQISKATGKRQNDFINGSRFIYC